MTKPQLTLPGTRLNRIAQPEPVALAQGEVLAVFIPGIVLRSLNASFRNASMGARMGAAAKVKKQRADVDMVLRSKLGNTPPEPPLTVTVTRVAPGQLDAHDNLPGSCKAIVDAIAAWLGLDDRDPRLSWQYDQRRDGRTVGVGIRIERRAEA